MATSKNILNEIIKENKSLTLISSVGKNATKEQNYFCDNKKIYYSEMVYENQSKEDLKKPILKTISKSNLLKVVEEKNKKEIIALCDEVYLEDIQERIKEYESTIAVY